MAGAVGGTEASSNGTVDVDSRSSEVGRYVEIFGVPVAVLGQREAVDRIERLADQPERAIVAFANAHTLNLVKADSRFASVLRGTDLILRDGIGVGLAGWMAGQRFPANLNGSDFTPRVLELAARRHWSVFFVGAEPGVAKQAADTLSRSTDGLRVAGTHDGMFPVSEELVVVEEIRRSGADIVVAGMGNPHQEMFLVRYLSATDARLGIGVGAFLDFTAGRFRRAPTVMNRWGVEWIFRLVQEPRRLWRRYVIGIPVFLFRCAVLRQIRTKTVRS